MPTLHLGRAAPCRVGENGVKGTLGPGLLPTLCPFGTKWIRACLIVIEILPCGSRGGFA